jgi:hypothetical protein
MVTYTPLEIELKFPSSASHLHRLSWEEGKLEADFRIPGETPEYIRVTFEDVDVIRVLDEMPLSTEEDAKDGLVPDHFAYIVQDSLFWNSQSEVLTSYAKLQHYRFITGWGCLDVLSRHEPLFSAVNRQ